MTSLAQMCCYSTSSFALAHFDSHITNHSHITVLALAHSMFTRTLWPDHSHITNHSHITALELAHSMFTRTVWPDHSHIIALAHYGRTTRTFIQSLAHHCTRTRTLWRDHSHIINHSHITVVAHSMFTRTQPITRTSPYSHIPCSLSHYDLTTRTLRLAHNQSFAHHRTRTLWPDHSQIDQTSTRTLTQQALAHSGIVKNGPFAHWST